MRLSYWLTGLAAPFVVAAATLACTDPSGGASVRAELVRLPGTSMSGSPALTSGGPELSPGSHPWTSEVSLTSVRAPITQIRLAGPGGADAILYRCAGATGAECLVELDGPALQDLIGTSPKAVAIGTYDRVNVGYCAPSETSHRAQVIGTTVIGGTTYSTKTTGVLGTSGPAEPVGITFSGCSNEYPIAPPLVIEDSTSATTVLRLYFDILAIASAALPSPQTSPLWVPACTPVSPAGSAPFVCLAYPEVVAVLGTVPPHVEHYRVNNGATVGLTFDGVSDLFYGGYFRRYTVEDQPWNPGFAPDGGVGSLTQNSDGTYRLAQSASSSGQAGAVFPAWRRETHSGTVNAGGLTNPYSAVRLP